MCGAWRLGSGGRSGGGGLECDTAEGQDQAQAQEQAWPHYYHTTTLQPLQSAAARRWDTGHTLPPAPSHHDVVTPDIGWQLHQAPGLACVKCRAWAVSGAFPEWGVRPGEITLQSVTAGSGARAWCRLQSAGQRQAWAWTQHWHLSLHRVRPRRLGQWQPWPASNRWKDFIDSLKIGKEWNARLEMVMNGLWYKYRL